MTAAWSAAADELLEVFVGATEDLPDDAETGIVAILNHPDVILAALGVDRLLLELRDLVYDVSSEVPVVARVNSIGWTRRLTAALGVLRELGYEDDSHPYRPIDDPRPFVR